MRVCSRLIPEIEFHICYLRLVSYDSRLIRYIRAKSPWIRQMQMKWHTSGYQRRRLRRLRDSYRNIARGYKTRNKQRVIPSVTKSTVAAFEGFFRRAKLLCERTYKAVNRKTFTAGEHRHFRTPSSHELLPSTAPPPHPSLDNSIDLKARRRCISAVRCRSSRDGGRYMRALKLLIVRRGALKSTGAIT